jgi:uncharacterized protein
MNRNVIIKLTESFVRKQLGSEGTGHDWWHIERIRKTALRIQSVKGGDSFMIDMALFLHDVGDNKVINAIEDDYTIADKFMEKQSVPEDIRKQIMFIIEHMSFSKSLGEKKFKPSIKFQIVQDADRLDALGAIGIARVLTYGGSKSRTLYDPAIKPIRAVSTKQYRNAKSTSINHFEEKLLLLKNLMNTKEAKRIAVERDMFMRNYLKQFFQEWEGKK